VLARAGLGEEGVEGVVTAADDLIGGHGAIGLDTMLQAEELPASLHQQLITIDENHDDDIKKCIWDVRFW
jgi:hypothetical protein